jgi:hypothetical protein
VNDKVHNIEPVWLGPIDMANPFKSLRESLERLVFAGLKPDAPAARKKSKLESLIESAEDLAARGLKPDEQALRGPMSGRKRVALGLGILLLGVFVWVLTAVLRRPAEQQESKAPPPPPIQLVPPGLKVDKNKDLEVVAMDFNKNKDPKEITGVLRNLTDRRLTDCEVSFDITTAAGGQLGGVATTVHNLPPHGSVHFRIVVPQKDAGFAMVRELRTD